MPARLGVALGGRGGNSQRPPGNNEDPHTPEPLQRCGLAAAGLAALRKEHPGPSWHSLGGHFCDSWG